MAWFGVCSGNGCVCVGRWINGEGRDIRQVCVNMWIETMMKSLSCMLEFLCFLVFFGCLIAVF